MAWLAEAGRSGAGARLATALAVIAVLALLAGCGDSHDNGEVTLTIGARATTEEEVLGQIYVQALREAGYRVKGELGIETDYRDVPLRELRAGEISGYPEHVDAVLERELDVSNADLPSDAEQAYDLARTGLEEEGLTAFPPTPYSLSRQIAFLRKTAEKHDLEKISDLRGSSEKMTLHGFSDCHVSADCLGGMEDKYEVFFESISYMYYPEELRQRFQFLEDGEYDAVTVYSTDGRLAAEADKFVALEEDKHVFRAGNVIFVTTEAVAEEAGPDYEETIVAAQEGLDLATIRRLDAEVDLDGKKPRAVAARYLRDTGLVE